MKKFTLFVWVCLAVVGLGQLAGAQEAANRKTPTPKATSNDRGTDGLNGPVRRVRIETASIALKEGKPIEGSRVGRGTTTYDFNGRRTDTVALPLEGTAPAGKQQYRYDDKGNITEMVVLGNDGSVLSKEAYQYEFDELGNWKKMTTSVAVYEDGKLSFEPVEVTYRIITYYYAQGIDKIAAATTSKPTSVSPPPANPATLKDTSGRQTPDRATKLESKVATNENRVLPASENKNPVTRAISAAPEDGTSAKNDSSKTADTPPASREMPSVPPARIPVVQASEEALRNAAINLPQAEYPSAAELTGQKGSVEVQVVIDEKGEVVGVRGTSGNNLLNQAAEAAALKARFSPLKLSPNPAKVAGVITYNLAPPSNGATNGGASQPKPDTVASSGTNTAALSFAPGATASEGADQFYRQGLSHLLAGRYTEAVGDLRQAVYLNPEDALAYSKLGVAYAALGQHKETVAVLKLAIRIKAEVVDAEAYYRLGEAYTALGKHSEALRTFKQAMYITRARVLESDASKNAGFPSLADLHYGLGLAYHNLLSFRDATNEFRQAVDLKPKFAEAHYGLALAYIALGDRQSAEKEERILRPLNRALADKMATALNTSPIAPPGITNGILGGRRP
jgi:TonB family protein